MKRALHILVFIALCTMSVACSVTRHIPDGSYLLQKVNIEDDKHAPKEERITPPELSKYIRQSPNKRFLGTNLYVWFYDLANPEKHNWWNNLKRKIGQQPILLDMSQTEQSTENLKVYMDNRGFFSSSASFEVDTVSRRKRATVTYRTIQRTPYRINKISYEFKDKFLQQIILPDTVNTLLKTGNIFDITVLDKERQRITDYLQQRGYYNFNNNNIEYVADTLGGDHTVGVRMVIKQHLTGYNDRGQAMMENNMIYRIDQINIYPNFDPTISAADLKRKQLDTLYYKGLNVIYAKRPNVRPAVLRQAVPLYPNYIYNSSQVNRTYNELMALGYFKSTKVSFTEQSRQTDAPDIVTYVGETSDSTRTRYTKEGYLQCNILCTPALKQSYKIDLEGSTTSSFYGLKATVGYQNRNVFRGAEALDASFSAGYEYMKARDAQKKNAMEFGFSIGISFPRFILPFRTSKFKDLVQQRSKLELSVNFQDRPYYRRTLWGATWTYSWADNEYSSYSIRPVDINIIDMSYINDDFLNSLQNEYLKNSYTTQLVAGFSFGYVYNNQRKHLGGNATVVRFNAETAGNLIDAFERLYFINSKLDGNKYYKLLGIRYAQYFRADINVSRKIMLGEVSAIVGRIYGGAGLAYGNSTSIPFDRLFYAGGSNSMRGWVPRTLGPGSVPEPKDQIYPSQLGDMKLEANLEFRFPIWGMIHGATFLDAGNIWFIKSNAAEYQPDAVFHFRDFYKQLGLNTGIGIRLDIKYVVLRLDWGIQLHNPNKPLGERWIHNFKWENTALNFGVGYPF